MFYAPWCGHCKKLHPNFDEAAKEMAEEHSELSLVFAKVDCTGPGRLTCKRFGVHRYPEIVMLHKGVYGKYSRPRKTKKDLKLYLGDVFRIEVDVEPDEEEEKPIPIFWDKNIPPPISAWDDFKEVLRKDLNTLRKEKKNALGFTLGVGIVIGWILKTIQSTIFSSSSTASTSVPKRRSARLQKKEQ